MSLFPELVAEEATGYRGRVHVLAPEVAHRIAAGEVIERPASAVKELIENSLDAGATFIEVEIEGGGTSLIRVRDDGSGMSREDAERAVGRHATSKIMTADDLARVDTLGFRGEALHAIGAVSSLALTTRERGSELGARVGVFAGETVESAPAAHSPGTTVEARNLFLNLPVRRGFLGTQRSEATPSPPSSSRSRSVALAWGSLCARRGAGYSRCRLPLTCGSAWRRSTGSRSRAASSP
jgi:DNA mismatch repair protein MutL